MTTGAPTGGGHGKLEGLEPVPPGAPLHDHLVMVTADGVERLAVGSCDVRLGRSVCRELVQVTLLALEPLMGKEVENREGAGFCGLGENVAGEEERVLVRVVSDRM